jgi:hypothetical protein
LSWGTASEGNGEEPMSLMKFGQRLEQMGFPKERPSAGAFRNKVVRHGLGLVDDRREE